MDDVMGSRVESSWTRLLGIRLRLRVRDEGRGGYCGLPC